MKTVEDKKKKKSASGSASAAGGSQTDSAASTPADGQSVDRIRDILFGAQMRDYEDRFNALEQRLLKEAEDLRTDIRERFNALQATLRKEVASLSSHLDVEQKKRAASDSAVGEELRSAAKELHNLIQELAKKTQGEVDSLRSEKTDRLALAELLNSVAGKLKGG